MNKSFKKILSIVLSVMMISSLMTVSLSVSAVEDGKVRVIVRNDTYSVENGAPWDGVLVDEWVSINNDTTMMSAVVDALNNHGTHRRVLRTITSRQLTVLLHLTAVQ